MKAVDLKKKYLDFFVKKNHQILPNVSLVPENDPTALFINSGMHPLIPYLLGESHPLGKRLVSNQRCLRTQDIEKIGNTSHLTFFEMLGNWSLGDYWKKEAIEWSWEFLTKELNLDPKRISVTCFAGDKDLPKDEESAKIWQSLGLPSSRIYFLGKEDNWWSVGENGPCGSDTEMFYDTGKKACGPKCRPGDNCGKYFEIWNDVFMEFNRLPNGNLEKLKQRNIDTGMGVERTAAMLQGKDDVYQTELFSGLINQIEEISKKKYEKENQKVMRIMADHSKAATFLIADGVIPSNKEQGYVLRRLIRRAINKAKTIGYDNYFRPLLAEVIKIYDDIYPELSQKKEIIYKTFEDEESKYSQTINRARKIFLKISGKISAKEAFNLYATYGLSPQQLKDKGYQFNQQEFDKIFKKHQEISRANIKKKFAGGLADHSKEVTKLHTITHLLHQALRQILGEGVHQVGSNITPERLRFDFTYPEKLTPQQIREVEDLVNQQIQKDLAVKMETMSLDEAKKKGALAFFADKYGEKVKVYSIGNFSQEVCGGPHVDSLGEIGSVKIIKEEAVGAGRRRIYAGIKQT
jgi:alanyl-tRNA synthetase